MLSLQTWHTGSNVKYKSLLERLQVETYAGSGYVAQQNQPEITEYNYRNAFFELSAENNKSKPAHDVYDLINTSVEQEIHKTQTALVPRNAETFTIHHILSLDFRYETDYG